MVAMPLRHSHVLLEANVIWEGRAVIFRAMFFVITVCLSFIQMKEVSAGEKFVITGLEAPPYIIVDNANKVSGITVELIKQAFKTIDLEPEFRISNWARAFETTRNGKADAIIPTIRSQDRLDFFSFPEEPLTILQMSLMQNPNKPIGYNGEIKSLNPYIIGKIRKARVSPEFDKAVGDNTINVKERTSFGLLALAVANNRLDAMAGDEVMGLWGAAENGVLNDIEVVHPHLADIPVFLAISKKSKFISRIDDISNALKKAKKNTDFLESLHSYEKFLNQNLVNHIILKSVD